MDLRLLCFALGASSSLLWPWLPSVQWGGLLLALASLCACCRRWRLLFLILGMLWMQASLSHRLAWLEGLTAQAPHMITARVQGTEPRDDKFVRLLLRVESLDDTPLTPQPLVRINAYQALPPLSVGSRITLVSSLKPAQGLANEAGLDGRRLLLGKGITATGNLRRLVGVEAMAPGWRERWLTQANTGWQGLPHAALLSALCNRPLRLKKPGVAESKWDLVGQIQA